MLGGRGMEQVREFETADGRRGRRRIPVLAPFEFFASSRLIRAQFHREGAKGSRRNKFTFWRAAPLRAAARRLAGFVARSSHTAPGIARRSRLASGPGGLQQNVKLFLREPLASSQPKPARNVSRTTQSTGRCCRRCVSARGDRDLREGSGA